MNKIRILFIMVMFVISSLGISKSVFAAGDAKIGYIDPITIVNSYDKTKDEEDALNAKYEKKQKSRERMVEKIRDMKNELELLSDRQRQKKQEEIDEDIRKLQDFDRETKAEVRKETDNIRRGIYKEIDGVIQDYAKKSGYSIILNNRVLLYADEQYDITREVLNIINSRYRRKK